MNISYLLYQAERTHTAAEQREIDTRTGELAAAIAGLGRARRRAVTLRALPRQRGTKISGTARADWWRAPDHFHHS